MKEDEIIRMALEAGLSMVLDDEGEKVVERFAALVAAHEREKCFDAAMKAAEKSVDTAMLLEREACAKVCEDIGGGMSHPYVAQNCAATIRARK